MLPSLTQYAHLMSTICPYLRAGDERRIYVKRFREGFTFSHWAKRCFECADRPLVPGTPHREGIFPKAGYHPKVSQLTIVAI